MRYFSLEAWLSYLVHRWCGWFLTGPPGATGISADDSIDFLSQTEKSILSGLWVESMLEEGVSHLGAGKDYFASWI